MIQQIGGQRGDHRRLAADAVRQPAAEQGEDDPRRAIDHRGSVGGAGGHVQGGGRIGGQIKAHIGRGGEAHDHPHPQDQHRSVGEDADAVRMGAGRYLAVVQGLGQGAADDQAERQHQGSEPEGRPPAVGLQQMRRQHGRQAQADRPAHQRGDRLAGRLPGADIAAPGRRRGLDQEGHHRADLAAEGEALDHAEDHRQHRRGQADACVAGGRGQAEDGHAHQHETQQHRRPAAGAVGEGADDQRPDRPGDETDAEGGQRQHQADEGGVGGEEGVADVDGEHGVGGEVVEFECVADHRRGDLSPRNGRRRLAPRRQLRQTRPRHHHTVPSLEWGRRPGASSGKGPDRRPGLPWRRSIDKAASLP